MTVERATVKRIAGLPLQVCCPLEHSCILEGLRSGNENHLDFIDKVLNSILNDCQYQMGSLKIFLRTFEGNDTLSLGEREIRGIAFARPHWGGRV